MVFEGADNDIISALAAFAVTHDEFAYSDSPTRDDLFQPGDNRDGIGIKEREQPSALG